MSSGWSPTVQMGLFGLRKEILLFPYVITSCKNIIRATNAVASAFIFFPLQCNVALSCSIFNDMWMSLPAVPYYDFFELYFQIFLYFLF